MNYLVVPGIKDQYRIESAPIVTPEKIIKTVCDHFDLNADGLKGRCRGKELVHARYVIFYLIRKHTSMTLKAAGLLFNRDHTTVIHGIEHLGNIMDTEPNVRDEVEMLASHIKQG